MLTASFVGLERIPDETTVKLDPVAVRPLQSSRVIEISWVFCF
jgi:hypothetical protein